MLQNDTIDLAQVLRDEGLQMIKRRVFLGRRLGLRVECNNLSQNYLFLLSAAHYDCRALLSVAP